MNINSPDLSFFPKSYSRQGRISGHHAQQPVISKEDENNQLWLFDELLRTVQTLDRNIPTVANEQQPTPRRRTSFPGPGSINKPQETELANNARPCLHSQSSFTAAPRNDDHHHSSSPPSLVCSDFSASDKKRGSFIESLLDFDFYFRHSNNYKHNHQTTTTTLSPLDKEHQTKRNLAILAYLDDDEDNSSVDAMRYYKNKGRKRNATHDHYNAATADNGEEYLMLPQAGSENYHNKKQRVVPSYQILEREFETKLPHHVVLQCTTNTDNKKEHRHHPADYDDDDDDGMLSKKQMNHGTASQHGNVSAQNINKQDPSMLSFTPPPPPPQSPCKRNGSRASFVARGA